MSSVLDRSLSTLSLILLTYIHITHQMHDLMIDYPVETRSKVDREQTGRLIPAGSLLILTGPLRAKANRESSD